MGNILYQRLKFAVGLRTGKEEGLIDYFIGGINSISAFF